MIQLLCCINKDFKEFVRCGRCIFCFCLLGAVFIMVMAITLIFPFVLNVILTEMPMLLSDFSSVGNIAVKLFPSDVKENMGVFAANTVLFYTIAISFICGKIIPDEIKKGKWIIPINSGYKGKILLASKCVVYGIGMAFPAFIMYILYYFAVSLFMVVNFSLWAAFLNSAVLGIIFFSEIVAVILISSIYKKGVLASVSVIVAVIAAPDILSLFSFGRYFPTYLFTFVYSSCESITELILPVSVLVILIIFLGAAAAKKIESMV